MATPGFRCLPDAQGFPTEIKPRYGHQADLEDYFTAAIENNFNDIPHDYFETTCGGHGRVEVRRHYTIDQFGDFPGKDAWKDFHTIGMVESERHIGDEVRIERRYYITSFTLKC